MTEEMEAEYAKMKGELKKRAMASTIGFIARGWSIPTRESKHGRRATARACSPEGSAGNGR